MSVAQALEAADIELNSAVRHFLFGADPIVIAKSPPGAGKTFLVECATAVATADPQMKVVIITPGVSQAYDIAERLLAYALPRLELVHAAHRQTPVALSGRMTVSNGWDANLNVGPGVLIANAHVLAAHLGKLPAGTFDVMIVDEAYQLAATAFMPVADLARRILMVGDPGQLPPVVSVDTTNLEAAAHKVHRSAPDYVLDRFPATPVYRLPVTRRLLPDTAGLVQQSFYPDLPFTSVVDPASRRLRFDIAGVEPVIDQALDQIAAGASMVAVTLPGVQPPHEEVDQELAAVMARLAVRFQTRGAAWNGQRLAPTDLGCIDPHVISCGAISARLREAGLGEIRVETVERWQGLQVPISIVRHPLSRVGQPLPFDLEAGRWCVALSRHQIGCIIVARESVGHLLQSYVHPCDSAAAGARDLIWMGFEAHRRIWDQLEQQGRIFRL